MGHLAQSQSETIYMVLSHFETVRLSQIENRRTLNALFYL